MNTRYRKTIIAGNWKMNKTPTEAKSLINEIKNSVGRVRWCEVVLCVPYIAIPTAVKLAKGSRIVIGAQNVHHEASGAYTGEISAAMLKDAGCKYVIVGHSERRQYFGETDAQVNAKTKAALAAGLRPIVCIGETLAEREAGITLDVITLQLHAALSGVDADSIRKVVIAYEPVWAIGTGKTATTEQAAEVNNHIRTLIRKRYGAKYGRAISILYGGSMNPSNAHELLAQLDIDGGLIGGASLKSDDLTAIVKASAQ